MYNSLIQIMTQMGQLDFSTLPTVKFTKLLLQKAKNINATIGDAHSLAYNPRLIPNALLEEAVASVEVELPSDLNDKQIDELATLFAPLLFKTYDACLDAGFSNLGAVFLIRARGMNLKLS